MTEKPNNRGKTPGYVTFDVLFNRPRKPAQRAVGGERARSRLAKILTTDPMAIVCTHRRLRRGIPQDSIKR